MEKASTGGVCAAQVHQDVTRLLCEGAEESCCQAGISHLPLLIDGVITSLLLIPSLIRAVEVSQG